MSSRQVQLSSSEEKGKALEVARTAGSADAFPVHREKTQRDLEIRRDEDTKVEKGGAHTDCDTGNKRRRARAHASAGNLCSQQSSCLAGSLCSRRHNEPSSQIRGQPLISPRSACVHLRGPRKKSAHVRLLKKKTPLAMSGRVQRNMMF
jgi:hypothetical protein